MTEIRYVDGVMVALEAGDHVPPVLPLPSVPQQVSRFQARAALIVYGNQISRPTLLAEVDALVAGLPTGAPEMTAVQAAVIREAWASAQIVERVSVSLNAIAPAVGLTSADLDQMFVVGAGLKA